MNSLFHSLHLVDRTISGKYDGTRLGLSMCKEILSRYGGKIPVISTENAGEKDHSVPIVEMTVNAMKIKSEKEKKNVLPPTTAIKENIWEKAEAMSRLGGRESLLKQLLVIFINGHEQKTVLLSQSIEGHKREQIRQTAHALKGNCGNIGARALHRLLNDIEKKAESEDFDKLAEMFEHVEIVLDKTLNIFNRYLDSD